MRRLWRRIFGSGSARQRAVTCYLRENGPIAYELDLFASAPRERADAMMKPEFSWAWRSRTREWTQLTRISLSAFLSDLPGGVTVVGVEGELPIEITDTLVKGWIRRFSRTHPGPLAAVITVSDGRQLLFVQQHASAVVNELLDAWAIDKGTAVRQAYPRLGNASLESLGERL